MLRQRRWRKQHLITQKLKKNTTIKTTWEHDLGPNFCEHFTGGLCIIACSLHTMCHPSGSWIPLLPASEGGEHWRQKVASQMVIDQIEKVVILKWERERERRMLSSFSSCSASISALGHTDGAYVEDVSGVASERYLLARWEPNTVNYTSCLSSRISPREMAGQGKLGICQRTILLERWWTFKCMSGEKGQGALLFFFLALKNISTQWCVNHGVLHSLLLGWQILYKQKQESVPYQKAFLDKSLVLSPSIYASVCVW